jgi:hypothetical protein
LFLILGVPTVVLGVGGGGGGPKAFWIFIMFVVGAMHASPLRNIFHHRI